jgi:hypothetical protein
LQPPTTRRSAIADNDPPNAANKNSVLSCERNKAAIGPRFDFLLEKYMNKSVETASAKFSGFLVMHDRCEEGAGRADLDAKCR